MCLLKSDKKYGAPKTDSSDVRSRKERQFVSRSGHDKILQLQLGFSSTCDVQWKCKHQRTCKHHEHRVAWAVQWGVADRRRWRAADPSSPFTHLRTPARESRSPRSVLVVWRLWLEFDCLGEIIARDDRDSAGCRTLTCKCKLRTTRAGFAWLAAPYLLAHLDYDWRCSNTRRIWLKIVTRLKSAGEQRLTAWIL